MNDDELLKALKAMFVETLEEYGLEKKPTAGAVRTRRYRERKASQNVTGKRHKTSRGKGNGVTKASPANVTATTATWESYAAAYRERWSVEPLRNAMVNSLLAQFVGRVGAEEAPQIAAFYVRSSRGLYVSAKHAVQLLLRNAEALRTEWATGHASTDTEARQADRTQSTANVFNKLIKEAEDGKQDAVAGNRGNG